MNKKVVKFAAYYLTGTIVLGTPGIAANAADIASQLPSAGMEAVISEVYEASTDVSIIEYLTSAVNSEYENLAVANVSDYVNIRQDANEESESLGKLYSESVATVLEEAGDWIKVQSGSVTGYIKSEYLVTGEAAEELIEQVGNKIATVNTTTLKVREEASTEATVQTLVPIGERLQVHEAGDEWTTVIVEDKVGFVASDYVEVVTEFRYAESKEEEAARLAEEERQRQEEAARLERERQAAANANRSTGSASSNSGSTSSNSSSSSSAGSSSSSGSSSVPAATGSNGQAVANYAVQFIGNPYSWGGTSLTNGADCSGFVLAVYAQFGVSLPHSSASMRSQGYAVSYSEAQPGDIICYSGHVGIYVGNGTIVNALNDQKGICYTNATYSNILAVRRIF